MGKSARDDNMAKVSGDDITRSSGGGSTRVEERRRGRRREGGQGDGPSGQPKRSRTCTNSSKKQRRRQERNTMEHASTADYGAALTPSRIGFLLECGRVVPMSHFSPVAADASEALEHSRMTSGATRYPGNEKSQTESRAKSVQHDGEDVIARRNQSLWNFGCQIMPFYTS